MYSHELHLNIEDFIIQFSVKVEIYFFKLWNSYQLFYNIEMEFLALFH